ncbi:HET-domain-containing protein [Coniochaeta ligniaria NRRL 30616]|uniref:HET-domain-containing protein n=1 Tax=Coniochaeta ligniaria NRRL 30616 TaxID=1408157 RepID=A0A1J7JBV8_9PEZI|nr:HET-domain-containing protein [Coniochaeta ligniaria NRRL 30616]
METDLCLSCHEVTFAMLMTGFERSQDYSQTRAASDQGCRLCGLAMDAYANQICVNRECDKIHDSPLLWRISGSGPGVREGMFKLDYRHFGPQLYVSVPEESSLFQDGIITCREAQAADSPRNLRLLRSWLQDCRSTHGECRHGSYSGNEFDDTTPAVTLPFRVIDVGTAHNKSDPPRLLSTHYKSTGRYLTLSHCWGKVKPPQTTKATREAWHTALPWDQLPKTFQDAIRLTRELGERFLWIDSLCIVQDDPAEVGAQIQLMGIIFEGSYCTIAAVDAKGADGSLAVDRGLFLSKPASILTARLRLKSGLSELQQIRPNETDNVQNARVWMEEKEHDSPNQVYEVVLQNNTQFGRLSSFLQSRAWHSRGWVFQERQLSRRCIFFTEDGLGWRCNQYWETEQTGAPERRVPATSYDLETTTAVGNYTYDVIYRLRMEWQGSVEDYSEGKLTYISDKDKALKGLEERLSARFDAVFRYGILDFRPAREVLHQQLLWLPKASRGSSLKNSPDFSCPTWSWMIIDGPVRWSSTVLLTLPEVLGQVHFDQPAAGQMQKLHISGRGRTVSLGPSFRKDLNRSDEQSKQVPEPHISWLDAVDAGTNRLMSGDGKEMIGWAALDTTDEPGQVIAVPLMQYFRLDDEEEPMCVDFLALVKIEEQNSLPPPSGQDQYYRVGRGRVIKDAHVWLENCEPFSFVVV